MASARQEAVELLFTKLKAGLHLLLTQPHLCMVIYRGQYGVVAVCGASQFEHPHIRVTANEELLEHAHNILEDTGGFEFDDPPLESTTQDGIAILRIYP